MKHIKYLLFSLSLILVIAGCESDPNGRMPDDIMDANVGVLTIAETSDVLVDVNDFAGFNLDFSVDVLFDPADAPFDQLDVVVVYNGDFTKQYVLETVTSVPVDVSYTIADLVSLIDEITAEGDIAEGDKFDFFTSITLEDGTFIPGYLDDGTPTNAPSVRNIAGVLKGAVANFILPVPCPFVPDDYVGTMDVYEQWNDGSGDATYTAEVSINADLTDDTRVVYDIYNLFTGDASSFWQVAIDRKTYAVSHYEDPARPADEVEMVVDVDLFGWGLGRLWFEDWAEAMLETCNSYIEFTITPVLNDTGLWWGTTVTYYIGDGALAAGGGKKSMTDYSGPKDPNILKALLISR
jgi:hypothetical protein